VGFPDNLVSRIFIPVDCQCMLSMHSHGINNTHSGWVSKDPIKVGGIALSQKQNHSANEGGLGSIYNRNGLDGTLVTSHHGLGKYYQITVNLSLPKGHQLQ